MKQVAGIWLPDHETHLVPFIETSERVDGLGTYQLHKYHAALPLISNRRAALDIGAHVGLWSRVMARDFAAVFSFEPVKEHQAVWRKNVTAPNARLFETALGAGNRSAVVAVTPGHSGHSRVADAGEPICMARLDGFGFGLWFDDVDFIKIDTEGYELDVVRGGEQTIRKQRPVIVVEQKPGMGARYGVSDRAAVDLLQSWGAKIAWEIGGDFCLTW